MDESEGAGATIYSACPKCGQFCKIPKTYLWSHVKGVIAKSYCKRCKRIVRLNYEFI